MEYRITATELARSVGDILGRIRYRGDSFVVDRNGEPVARIGPLRERAPATLLEALSSWREAGEPEAAFSGDLEEVASADRPPVDRWGS